MDTEKTLLEQIEEAMTEESADTKKYLDMAAVAQKSYPKKGYGSVLRDIAKEESVHHRHLQAILSDIKCWESTEEKHV